MRVVEEGPGGQRFRQMRFQAHRVVTRLNALLHPLGVLVVMAMQPSARMTQPGVGEGEVWVQGDRVPEQVRC